MPFRALITAILALAVASPAFAADPLRDQQWGLEMVKAESAWATSTGVGALVAVIDTGVQPNHPDLSGRLHDEAFDFIGDDGRPTDENGHGTHVTGIIAANRENDEGIAGVAPGARVLALRVLNADGEGLADDTVKAIDYAIDAGAHVINLSLGERLPLLDESPGYQDALARAVAEGIVVVLAAGNTTLPRCENPDVAEVVCVGAVDSRGTRSAFSSFGMNVDLMAPGGSGAGESSEDILSTYIQNRYETLAGTSQAAPHVAGVAALLVSLGVRGQDAADRIIATAAPAGSTLMYGAGIVDAAAAVDGLAPPPPDPGDPDPVAGSFSTKSPVRRRAVRRRGFKITCEAARPGRCKVAVTRRGRRIAGGGVDVPAKLPTVATAKLNRAGKRLVRKMGRRLRVRVAVTLPGEATRTRRVTIKRPA